jgi:hypothetical protein
VSAAFLECFFLFQATALGCAKLTLGPTNWKGYRFGSGLPDFSWYSIPKRGKIYQNDHKFYQLAKKYIYEMAVE